MHGKQKSKVAQSAVSNALVRATATALDVEPVISTARKLDGRLGNTLSAHNTAGPRQGLADGSSRSGQRPDILVHAEEVFRIVLGLDPL
jgi:hypothetical protein